MCVYIKVLMLTTIYTHVLMTTHSLMHRPFFAWLAMCINCIGDPVCCVTTWGTIGYNHKGIILATCDRVFIYCKSIIISGEIIYRGVSLNWTPLWLCRGVLTQSLLMGLLMLFCISRCPHIRDIHMERFPLSSIILCQATCTQCASQQIIYTTPPCKGELNYRAPYSSGPYILYVCHPGIYYVTIPTYIVISSWFGYNLLYKD